jgi:methylmalonyl-CoA mutase
VTLARERQQLQRSQAHAGHRPQAADFDDLIAERDAEMDGGAKKLLAQWPDMQPPTPATNTW